MKVGFRYNKRIIQKTVLSELNVIKEYWCPEKCPRKKNPEKIALGKMPSGQLPTEKLFYSIFVAFDIIILLFLLKLFMVTMSQKATVYMLRGS